MSTDHLVNTKKLGQLCREQRELLLKGFAPHEIKLQPTLHQLYSHLAEKIGTQKI